MVLILQVEDEMEYDILQKVALSKCEDKAGFLIDKMMQVRHKACRHNYNWYKCSVISEDLTSQEKDIYDLSKVKILGTKKFKVHFVNGIYSYFQNFHRKMKEDDSAIKLLIQHIPKAITNLLDGCISSYNLKEQIVFFDFFLFCPPYNVDDNGKAIAGTSDTYAYEFVFFKLLLSARKGYFLDHLVFYALVTVSKTLIFMKICTPTFH